MHDGAAHAEPAAVGKIRIRSGAIQVLFRRVLAVADLAEQREVEIAAMRVALEGNPVATHPAGEIGAGVFALGSGLDRGRAIADRPPVPSKPGLSR